MRVRGFRHTLELQTLQGSTAAGTRGQTAKAFATVDTFQGSVEMLTGRELAIAREISPRTTHKVECYYQSLLTPAARLKLGTRTLNIESVDNRQERGRYAVLLCAEEVA